MTINKAILLGRLGDVPQVVMFNANRIINFSIATSSSYKGKDSGETVRQTEWHNVVVYNKNIAEYVSILIDRGIIEKGTQVYIEGTIKTRKWTDPKTNIDRYTTEIVLSNFSSSFKVVSSKPRQKYGRDEGIGEEEVERVENVQSSQEDEELPF